MCRGNVTNNLAMMAAFKTLANRGGKALNVGMKWMIRLLLFVAIPIITVSADETTPALLARGKYLVEAAGACADCHTARDWKGVPDREHWLQGAKLDFKPSRMMPWADTAPDIAGLPGLKTDEQAIKFFETGVNASGKTCAPPMPQYRFNHDDAKAIVAYLRSLPSAKK